MNKPELVIHEQISALLDDELDSSEQDDLLAAITEDAGLAETWQRYHLIRAAVRREALVHLPDLPSRVESFLGTDIEPIRRTRSQSPAAGRWIPGLALAASVAGLVSLGLFSFLTGEESTGSAGRNQVVELDQGTKWETTSPELEHTLNAFLVEHGEFTPMSNMNGLMAYAKFVSYNSER